MSQLQHNHFAVIEADPPWSFRHFSSKNGSQRKNIRREHHYDLMTLDDMMALPVDKYIQQDAVLFMWVTFPNLFESKPLAEAWGFDYKTAGFVWLKRSTSGESWQQGNSYSVTMANAELCLFFSRGNPERLHKGVSQVIFQMSLLYKSAWKLTG